MIKYNSGCIVIVTFVSKEKLVVQKTRQNMFLFQNESNENENVSDL